MSREDAAWRVEFSRSAARDLRRLDPPIRRRILAAIEALLADPPRGDVKRLTGLDAEYRLRVGDWRVRFRRDADEQVLLMERILPRGRAYRD